MSFQVLLYCCTRPRVPGVAQWLRRLGRSRDRFPVVSLDFSLIYSFRPHYGPVVDTAPSENEYREHFLGVKAAGAWGWQPYHLRVPNVIKSGSLNLLEPSGPHRACYGTPLPFTPPRVGQDKTGHLVDFCALTLTKVADL